MNQYSSESQSVRISTDSETLLSPYEGYTIEIDDEYETNVGEVITRYGDAQSADVGIVGIPFDTGCVAGTRGSRYGPNSVRDHLTHGTCYNPAIDIDISSDIDIVDFGDIVVRHTDLQETHSRVEQVLTEISNAGIFPISVGGDHSLTYPTAKALMNATTNDIGVINIDAHHDVRHSHGGEISAGTPFRRLLEDESEKLHHENFVELGLSGWHNTKSYIDWVRENGAEIITAREIHKNGIVPAVDRALDTATAGTEAVFLSIDIDVLDASAAPGTSAPSPGGLLNHQLLELVYQLGRHDAVQGADLMEVAPSLESDNITAHMGAAVITQLFGAYKSRM